jgi:hypothetical protein
MSETWLRDHRRALYPGGCWAGSDNSGSCISGELGMGMVLFHALSVQCFVDPMLCAAYTLLTLPYTSLPFPSLRPRSGGFLPVSPDATFLAVHATHTHLPETTHTHTHTHTHTPPTLSAQSANTLHRTFPSPPLSPSMHTVVSGRLARAARS